VNNANIVPSLLFQITWARHVKALSQPTLARLTAIDVFWSQSCSDAKAFSNGTSILVPSSLHLDDFRFR
jgi:hypothetical protein